MGIMNFYIVDVFTEDKYAGNQLAVFRGGRALSAVDMQRIAREINFSETTFIISDSLRDGGYDVRIFTPLAEVPFAGHPVLGTAHVVRSVIAAGIDNIVLNLQIGQIAVTFTPIAAGRGLYWMKQIEPIFGRELLPEIVAPVVGLTVEDIDARFPIEEVSTGLPHILVPLTRLEALRRARLDREKYFALIQNTWAKAVLIFCPEPHRHENDLSVRDFAEAYGITEDPASGSGNGCLAAYLVRHRYWGQAEVDVRCEQGYEIGRPSLLHLRARESEGHIEVQIGGQVMMVARGEWL